MGLVTFMQYAFLASIIFDLAVGVWFYKHSRHLHSAVVMMYLINLFFSVGWEVVLYISFFSQQGDLFNFFFNASTFTFGITGLFTTLCLLWVFFEKQYLKKIWIIVLGLVTGFFVVSSYIPGVVVGSKIIDAQSNLFYLNNATLTVPLYLFVIVELTILITFLIKGYLRSLGRKKDQAKLLIIAFGITTSIGVLTHVIIPLIVKIIWTTSSHLTILSIAVPQVLGGICVSIISAVIAYAILRYRIFSIRYHIQRYTLNFFAFLLFAAILFISLYFTLVSISIDRHVGWPVLLGSILILLWPVKVLAESLTRYFFPQTQVDLYELTIEEQKILDSIPTLNTFVRLAVDHFMSRMPVESIAIYSYNKQIGSFQSAYPSTGRKIAEDEPWLLHFQKNNYRIDDNVKEHLKCKKVFPIRYNHQLIALLCLGDRINQKDYSQADDIFINEFCKFLSFNLWNCLYLQNQIYEHGDN